jgi:hypothetical protein
MVRAVCGRPAAAMVGLQGADQDDTIVGGVNNQEGCAMKKIVLVFFAGAAAATATCLWMLHHTLITMDQWVNEADPDDLDDWDEPEYD